MKLIKINTDHYVIVDDSEIKEGDWMIRNGEQPTLVTPNFWWDFGVPYKKITHSTQPIEEGTTIHGIDHKRWNHVKFIDLSEVKELIGEVDVEKKAELYVWGGVYLTEQEKQQTEIAYMTGYNQALEDNKDKKYTRNEVHALMCRAFEQGLKKADILEAGLEGKETDVECAWILTRHDSTPKTEWEVEFDENGKLKLV